MDNNEITVKFEYGSQKMNLRCKPDDKIKEVCQKAAS